MTKFYEQPLRLVWNKLVRYPGGREIDRFRGIYPGASGRGLRSRKKSGGPTAPP